MENTGFATDQADATEKAIPDPPDFERAILGPPNLDQGDPYGGTRQWFQFSGDAEGTPFRDAGDGRRFIENDDF